MNAIVLVLDGLHHGYLGAYGNTWIDTPAFDHLAAESFLFEQAYLASTSLADTYRGLWFGAHPLAGRIETASLAAEAKEIGLFAALLSDDADVAALSGAEDFSYLAELDFEPPQAPAERIEEMCLAQSLLETIRVAESADEPYLVWCHSGALARRWEAPLAERNAYRVEDDPPSFEGVLPPSLRLAADFDPDEAQPYMQAYAAEIGAMDDCLGGLATMLGDSALGDDTLLAVVSSGGLFLGEHHRIGRPDTVPYSSLIHAPLLLRLPGCVAGAMRSQALVQPADLWATLIETLIGRKVEPSLAARSLMPVIRGEARAVHDRLLIANGGGRPAIRTPAWLLVPGETAPELYAKPDDYWEANNVADRCAGVVEELDQAANDWLDVSVGKTSDLQPLPSVLEVGMR